ncbi:intracellular protein transport protein USO1-like [Vespula pensylvanica]|uniref:intracellular protein transport protein USO1-like n=1 Tax=Vespula pensylvanica TaxID=30213 RepID=UPI001CB9E603|nr:intracellular protein transport protein USO1-like [Vespula pensylvanica]
MKKKSSEVEGSQGKDFVSKKVQASCELKHCESCNIASETILRMINAIRSAFHENKLISAVAEERDLLKGDIYEKTQWAVMRRLAAAIEMDVKTTFEMMQGNDMKREAIKRNYEEKLNSLEAELSRKGTDFELLRGENFQLEDRIENVKRNFNALKEKNFQLEETKERLTIELKDTRIKLERTAESWDILQSQIVKLAENKLELENSVRGLTEKIVDTRSACLETERALRILLTELQRENDSIKKEYRVKLEKLETELKTEMKYREIEKEPEAVRSEGLYEERVLMPGDDPVLDMTRQLISNRRKIEHLQRQNERLSKTLNRLREYHDVSSENDWRVNS